MMRMVSVPIFCAKEERSVLRNVLYLFIFPGFGSTDKEYFPNPHHIIVGLSLSCFEFKDIQGRDRQDHFTIFIEMFWKEILSMDI